MIVVNYYRPVITVVLIVSRSKTMKLQKIINDLHQSRTEWNGKSRIMRKTLIPCQTKAVSVQFSQIPLPSGWMIMMMIRESNTNHWIIRSNGIADNILNWSPKNWGGNNKSLEFSLGSSSFASWELRLRGLSFIWRKMRIINSWEEAADKWIGYQKLSAIRQVPKIRNEKMKRGDDRAWSW